MPKAVYAEQPEQPIGTVVDGDCLSTLHTLPTGYADVLLTDPPYCAGGVSEASRVQAPGQGLRSETIRRFGWFTGDNMTTGGLVFLLRAMAFEACRVVKPTGHLVVFCDWRLSNSLAPAIESAGLRFQDEIIWDKQHMGLGNGVRKRHEKALLFTFGSPKFHAANVASVLTYPRVSKKDREHQTQKPVELLRDIIRLTSPVGGMVVDPFAGPGSTGVAALLEGRNALLVERDPEHAATARRRIAECRV